MRDAEIFLDEFRQWIAGQENVEAAALVGSWARDAARDDSDVDIVIVTNDPDSYLRNDEWLTMFGHVAKTLLEDWGLVQSRRTFYASGLEVEFGITTPEWTRTKPVDPGTEKVIQDGMKILFDPQGILRSLLVAVERK